MKNSNSRYLNYEMIGMSLHIIKITKKSEIYGIVVIVSISRWTNARHTLYKNMNIQKYTTMQGSMFKSISIVNKGDSFYKQDLIWPKFEPVKSVV